MRLPVLGEHYSSLFLFGYWILAYDRVSKLKVAGWLADQEVSETLIFYDDIDAHWLHSNIIGQFSMLPTLLQLANGL